MDMARLLQAVVHPWLRCQARSPPGIARALDAGIMPSHNPPSLLAVRRLCSEMRTSPFADLTHIACVLTGLSVAQFSILLSNWATMSTMFHFVFTCVCGRLHFSVTLSGPLMAHQGLSIVQLGHHFDQGKIYSPHVFVLFQEENSEAD